MTSSPNLALPYLDTGQAQKELTHNEALAALDILGQISVINATTTAPPGSPTDGQSWIVGASATGAWAGKDGQIAAWFSGWKFYPPKEGWTAWDRATDRLLAYSGTAWGLVFEKPTAQVPTLSGAWIGLGGGYGNPRYFKTADGKVHIEGAMQSGEDGTAFTLLAGFRPPDRLIFLTWSAGGPCRVDVQADGTVAVTASNAFGTSFAGISFFAA